MAWGLTPCGPVRFYVGCVRVLDHETWEEALERRRKQHEGDGKRGALWLRICTEVFIDKLRLAKSLFDARAWELIDTGRLFSEKGFCVRGAAFCSITIGPLEVSELHALASLASPQELKRQEVGRASQRHMGGKCYTCGHVGHMQKDCEEYLDTRRAYGHNPAAFPPKDGCYWNKTHNAYFCRYWKPRSKRPPKLASQWVYVRPSESGLPEGGPEGRWLACLSKSATGILAICEERCEAAEEACEQCLQLAGVQDPAIREYQWAPRQEGGMPPDA